MPQEPDKDGRIVVSKKINAEEWGRSVDNCKKLPGKVTLDNYVESALKMKNDYLENESPAVEIKGQSKMKELAEDLIQTANDLEEQKIYIANLERSVTMLQGELQVYEKVAKKVPNQV